jgi:NAD(P)-dependent dehydrogenase (short-subunit alcohol dehydrogenase family)
MRFAGKVAVVTGGAGGIGRATAELLAREGARVLIADRLTQGEEIAAALRGSGLDVQFRETDISVEQDVAAATLDAEQRWGRLDIMVANAGISGRGTADQIDRVDWDRVMCAKHEIPAMRRAGAGAIVNTASIIGLVGYPAALPYAAAKGAVVNMTRSMALDCAKDRIRVNAVCPGFISAPTTGEVRMGQPATDQLIALHPLGRLGEPEDVARAIAFLASDDAAFITGTSLVVDGGYTAR